MTHVQNITAALVLWVSAILLGCSSSGAGAESPPAEVEPAAEATQVGSPVPGGVTASATIGANGGVLSSADGRLTLSIPAAALTADTMIGITPISNFAHGGIGNGYRLTPDGQTFQQPINLVFAYNAQETGSTVPELLDVAFQTVDGFWQLADTATVDTTAKTITATTTHFTDWAFLARYRLTPSSATVMIKSGAQMFKIEHSFPVRGERPTPGADRPLLGYSWTPISVTHGARVASNWSVNSITGGNGTYGTIHADVERGGYAAPDTKPNPSTVDVSVLIADWPLHPTVQGRLVASVTILDQLGYTGSFNLTASQDGGYTIEGSGKDVVWTLSEDTGDVRKYQMTSGTILATIKYQGCDTKTVTVPSSTINELAVYTSTNAAYPNRYSFGVNHFGSAAGGSDTVTLSCSGSTMDIPVSIISFRVDPCYTVTPLGSDLPGFADEKLLENASYSSSCGALPVISGSWSFAE